MGSTVIPIPDEEHQIPNKSNYKKHDDRFSLLSSNFATENDTRRLIHGVKVGVALVFVSLIYFLDPVYEEIGDNNAMWAVMTVVVIFEFYAGATLAKGLNRGMGTILGGGLGFFVATIAHKVGNPWNSILVGTAMLLFGGIATYWRLKPKFKVRFDYGAIIFILTFSLVALSGLREAQIVIEIARERLLMIVLGFVICIFTSLFVFPIWASDELHLSTISKFDSLASSIEECLEEYFGLEDSEKEEEQKPIANFNKCRSVLNSKSKDESLANFARWEPWHGKFGITYPWEKYLKIGESLRDLAATLVSLKPSLGHSPTHKQEFQILKQSIKQPSEAMGRTLAWGLRELAESIKTMRKCNPEELILPELKSLKFELYQIISGLSLKNADGIAIGSFVYLLMDIEDKVEDLAVQVKQLGEVASFDDIYTAVKN